MKLHNAIVLLTFIALWLCLVWLAVVAKRPQPEPWRGERVGQRL